MAHYDIFREQLAIKYPAYGHALWEPSPGRLYSPVEVGDVGYVREGKFHRLFNALLPADHPSHRTFGVPEHHVPLVPNPSEHIDVGTLKPSHLCSHGISVTTGESDFHAKPNDLPQVSYVCTKRQRGAVSFLPAPVRRQDTIARGDFGQWIIKHIGIWFAFARRLGLGIEQMEDIILVTGCHRTRSWANVTFLEGYTDAEVSFGVEVTDADGPGINIKWQFAPERVRGALLNWGPDGKNLPEDQCVFIRGFRVTRTLRILPKHLIAAAGPSSDPDEYDDEPDMELIAIPAITKYRDPLHLLLEHVAENAPDCDMVLVHDDDLARIAGNYDSNETLKVDEVIDLLQQSQPEIQQIQCDPLGAGEDSLMTGNEATTVAMFSGEFQEWGTHPIWRKGHNELQNPASPSVQPPILPMPPSQRPSESAESQVPLPCRLSDDPQAGGAPSHCAQSQANAPQHALEQTLGSDDVRSRVTDPPDRERALLQGSSVGRIGAGSGDTLLNATAIGNLDDVLSWTSQDPRQSQLFSPWGVVYRFHTETDAQGQSTTILWRTIRANKEEQVARLEWAPGGGLGCAFIGKNQLPMADLVRRDPRMPSSRIFNGPDGFQYRWRPSTTNQDIVLQDPNNNVIAFVRPTRPTRYQGIGDVYAELHFVRMAAHPPLMDTVTVTAMLYRVASALNL